MGYQGVLGSGQVVEGGRWEEEVGRRGVGEVEVGKEGGWEGWRGCLIPACYKEGRRRKCLDGEKFGGR